MNGEFPPGQRKSAEFPRFGMPASAPYRPNELLSQLVIKGEVARVTTVAIDELAGLRRVEQISDLHCVTTWSYSGIRWGGYPFRDLYEEIVLGRAEPHPGARWVVFRGDDGHRASLPLEDALAPDVLLADRMNGEALSFDHGAPLRLVAPAHYGYKSVKHLKGIEFWSSFKPGPGLLEHPRARVALEERGRGVPGKLLRYVYRPLITSTARRFRAHGVAP